METNETNKTEQTKFEELLSQMSLEEKSKVFDHLKTVEDLFKDYAERAGYKWLDIVSQDNALRDIFVCTSVAGGVWYNEYRKQEEQKSKSHEVRESETH